MRMCRFDLFIVFKHKHSYYRLTEPLLEMLPHLQHLDMTLQVAGGEKEAAPHLESTVWCVPWPCDNLLDEVRHWEGLLLCPLLLQVGLDGAKVYNAFRAQYHSKFSKSE